MIVKVRTLAVTLLALSAVALRAAEPTTVLRFPRLNDTFRNLAPDIAPVTSAGITIKLSSPSNSLTVRSHELHLTPLGASRHHFRGRIDFMGKAELVAEFESALPGGLEDQVLLPIQQVEIEGEIDFVKMPGGYDVTTRKLPGFAEVAMQSRLANQLVGLCDMMTILTGGDCSGLEAAFNRVRLPLPAPGETYFIADDDLTADERRLFDDYLASTP